MREVVAELLEAHCSEEPPTSTSHAALLSPTELRIILAWLSLEIMIVFPSYSGSSEAVPSARKEACRKIIDSMKMLIFDDIAVADMVLRTRFLTLLCILAPVAMINRVVSRWTEASMESDLAGNSRGPDTTPAEYRVPMLGFHGVLRENPDLYGRAAESLWVRHHDAGETQGKEIAYRFRYLIRGAGARKVDWWSTAHLQEERLQIVLRRFLDSDVLNLPRAGGFGSAAEELESLLVELQRGWVFGSSQTPESLVELIALPSREVAEASLRAVLEFAQGDRSDFLAAYRRRLRRVRAVAVARGEYRATSRFATLLEELAQLIGEAS